MIEPRCAHDIRADGACDCGLWYDPVIADRRSVSTQEGETAGRTHDGDSHLDDRDRLLSAPGPKAITVLPVAPLPDARVALPDANEPIGALARSSITRPLVYCPTCRDTHAEGAPHFLNRTRENRR